MNQKTTRCCLSFAVVLALSIATARPAEKLKPEEILQRHLQSLGPNQVKGDTLKADGGSTLEVVRGGSPIIGKAALLSNGRKVRVSMVYGLNDYPGEEIAYDGDKVQVGWIRPGARSDLEQFFKQFNEIVSEGLLGGGLSTAWPLRELAERKAELKYDGLKKVDDKQFHAVKYQGRKGGSAQTTLYFDPETFRHCHSIHKVRIGVPMVHNPNAAADQEETWYILKESFTDFQEVGGGALPTTWILEFTTQTGRTGSVLRWTNRFSTIEKNIPIDPAQFVLK